MHPKKLGEMLVERLRTQTDLDLTENGPLIAFVGATPTTVQRWLSRDKPPRGERLNKLWHFLADIGVPSPELNSDDDDDAFSHYLGRLLAYDVITLKTATHVLGGLTSEARVYDVIRGDSIPVKEGRYDLAKLRTEYGDELALAISMWEPELNKARATVHKPTASVTKPNKTLPEAPPSLAKTTIKVVEPSPGEPVADSPPPDNPKGEQPMQPQSLPPPPRPSDDAAPQQGRLAPAAPVLPPVVEPVSNATPEQIFALAERLSSLIPWINRALNDWTEEDRAAVRNKLGDEAFFALTTSLNRMSGRRAFTIGRNRSSD